MIHPAHSLLTTFIALSAIFFPTTAVAFVDDNTPLTYTVDFAEARNHYVTVTMNVVATEKQTELMMAVWTPGSYLVREYARHLDSLKITGKLNDEDQEDTGLPFRKTRKNRWVVDTTPGKPFSVSYRLYCNEVSVRTNFVNRRYAVLNGAPTFLTVPERVDQPHHVTLSMPKGWKRSATSLDSDSLPHAYRAQTFDELVDSPIVAGLIDTYPFDVDGVAHQLINVGESGYWDGAKAAQDLKSIVLQHQKMWNVTPYKRYAFLNVIAQGRGGLEHDNCCLMLANRWGFRVEEKYQDWLSLASHEFFHTWNVRRLRPKPLMTYDYEDEIYTDCLWIAEGITNYYEDVLLVRAGLIDRKTYLKRLSKNIETVQSTNGRNVQSLRDASFDTWIKFYRPDENSANTRVSYYSKGAIVAFLLDGKIRQLTDNTRSLDDVMRLVWNAYHDEGYTQKNFRDAASEVAGQDLADWFKHAVDSTNELEYEDALDHFGLRFVLTKPDGSDPKERLQRLESRLECLLDELGSEKTSTPEEKKDDGDTDKPADAASVTKPKRWLGVKLAEDTIKSVIADSPATKAGLNPKDRLIGINGFSIHTSLEKHLEQFQIGDQIELLVSRKGELIKLPITIAEAPASNWTLAEIIEPTEQQIENLNSWIPASK